MRAKPPVPMHPSAAAESRPSALRAPEAAVGDSAAFRAPAMTDVARLAGVSHMTVSRVLNDVQSVRPATRARVHAAIDQLGYRRNVAARALVTGRSQMLGVVMLNSTLYGPASTLHSIEEAARHEGYLVSVASVRSIDRSSVGDAVARLVDQGVDGVVVVAPLTSTELALAGMPREIPLVVVEGDPDADVAVVCVDQEQGAKAATEHLLAVGHRTVWHVAGPNDWLEARGRVRGWRAALEAAGAEVPPPLPGDWSPRSGYEAGHILARMPEVTAVFVANDPMALGLLRAFRERGLSVPERVSVVGFDDVPEAEFFAPPLTTVRQDFDSVGRNSLHLLVDQIETGDVRRDRIVVDSELIIRESTAPPAAAASMPRNRKS
jgi:DNA-binding LacI/PurR family transcriptional regulator